MALQINANGTPTVFNNQLVTINGVSAGDDMPLNDFIKAVSWSTGSQAKNVASNTKNGFPITNNQTLADPRCSITFAPGAFDTFYKTYLNGGASSQVTIQIINYATGNLGGDTQTVLLENCRLDTNSQQFSVGQADSPITVSFVATFVGFI